MSSKPRAQADLFDQAPDEPRRAAARPFDVEAVAWRIWSGGTDPRDTLAEQYLAQCGLPLPDSLCNRVIRFHGSLAFAKDQRLPGMLTLMRDLHDDRAVAVTRVYLDEGARKIAQRIIGRAFRGVAKLDERVERSLHVAIGIETALGAFAAGHRPAWMAANSEALKNLASLPLTGVETLSIPVEAGDGTSMRAAAAAAAHWGRAGREARIIEVSKPGAAR